MSVSLYDESDAPIRDINPQQYSTPAGDGWQLVSIPLADLNAAGRIITGVQLAADEGGSGQTFHLDDFGFAR